MVLNPVNKVFLNNFGLLLVIFSLISVNYASDSESNLNTQQQHQQQQIQLQQQYIPLSSNSHSHSSPVVRNVDISNNVGSTSSINSGGGHRYVTGGKYRSSFYYPKSSKTSSTSGGGGGGLPTAPSAAVVAVPTLTQSSMSAMSSSQSVPAPMLAQSTGGQNPVWVVIGRQGTPFEGYSSQQSPSNYYYQYPEANDRDDKYYYNGNSNNQNSNHNHNHNHNMYSYQDDPYQIAESIPGQKWESLFSGDSEEEDELDRNDLDEISAAQLKGLMKTRRTGSTALGGLLSLKGLKLSAIGLFYLFRGVFMLLWRFLPWIFLIMVAFLFIPVPILTIPANSGRSENGQNMTLLNMTDMTDTVASLVNRVASSDQCVERISCEIRRQSRDTWFHTTLKMLIYQYKDSVPEPMQRMAQAYIQHRKCKLYSCHFIDSLKKNFT